MTTTLKRSSAQIPVRSSARTRRAQSRVSRIILCETEADEHEQAGRLRWEAAQLIAAELEAGKSTRDLAGEIGKSQTHVTRMARVWRESPETQRTAADLTAFNDAYQSFAGKEPGRGHDRPIRPTPTTDGGGWWNRVNNINKKLTELVENVGVAKPEDRSNAAAMLRKYADKLEA